MPKPVKIEKYRRPADQVAGFSEVGFSGLNESGGIIREEFLPQLKGRLGIRIIKEMRDNDPIVGAMLFAIGMLIRSATWKVKPFSEDNAHKKQADFLSSCMQDMSGTWTDTMSEVMTMAPFGWAWLETVYKKRNGYTRADNGSSSKFKDGLVGWRKLPLRSQDSLFKWDFDDHNGVRAFNQVTANGKSATIPIGKSLLFRTESNKNNPEGRSVLRNSYRPWFFKKRIEEVEGVGVERDLAGLPMLQPPEGLDIWNPNIPKMVQYKNQADTLVRNIRRDEQEGILLPFGWTLELLSTGGSRTFDTTTIIGRYNNQIAMTCLADFIILGHNNRYGSKALAGNKTQMFQMSIIAWLDMIQDVFNRYAVPRLWLLNGFDVEEMAELRHGDVSVPNLTELADYVYQLHQAGMEVFPNVPLEKHLFTTAGFPTDGVEFGRKAEPVPIVSPGGLSGKPNAGGGTRPAPGGPNPRGNSGGPAKKSRRYQRRRLRTLRRRLREVKGWN